jgi:hypothetical protein
MISWKFRLFHPHLPFALTAGASRSIAAPSAPPLRAMDFPCVGLFSKTGKVLRARYLWITRVALNLR